MRAAPRQEGPDDDAIVAGTAAPPATDRRPARSRWWWLLTAPLVVLMLHTFERQHLQQIQFKQAFLTNLVLLLALLAVLLWIHRRSRRGRPIFERRWQAAAALLLVLVGAWARTHRLDVYPPQDGQLWEEAQMGAGGYASMLGQGLDNFFPITTLVTESGFRLFGVSMHSLRIPFLVLGVVSVPLFFLAARFFLRTFLAAWIATGLFATSALLSATSRIALETMAPVCTECLALAALFNACVQRNYVAFAVAGFANGLLLTEYFSFKVIPVYAALLALTAMLRESSEPYCNTSAAPISWRGFVRRSPLLLIAAAFGVAVIVPVLLSDPSDPLMPLVEGIERHNAALSERLTPMSALQELDDIGARVKMVSTDLFVGGGGADLLPVTLGAIDFYTGVIGVLALLYCILGAWRSPAKLFLVVSIVVTVILSGALVQNPMRYRLIPLLPLWFLAVAVPLDDLLVRWPQRRVLFSAVAVAGLIALAVVNYHNLFVVALNDSEVQVNFYDLNMLMAREIAARQRADPHAMVYLLSQRQHFAFVNDYFFLYDYHRVRVVTTVADLADAHGFLIADNEFVPPAAAFPRVRDCQRWRTAFHHEELLSCQLP